MMKNVSDSPEFVLAVIPARGGSQGVPRKNILPFAGKPLIAYTIEAARQASAIDVTVVSTDDEEIAAVGREYGAEVVMRPPEYATATSPTHEALIHAAGVVAERYGREPTIVLTLEPTTPLRQAASIDRCVEIFRTTDADSVISVVETRSCYGRIDSSGRFGFLFPGQPRQRQRREPLYQEAGVVYGTRLSALRTLNSVLGERLYPLIVSADEAHDINELRDFLLGEYLAQQPWETPTP